jgi:copper chaperone
MTLDPQGRTELLVSGGGCSCCAPGVAMTAVAAGDRADVAASGYAVTATTATFAVAGMTCANCVRHVTDDLAALDGVAAVDVDLVAGGVSTVTVRGDRALDSDAIAAAVAEAGYEVVAR